MFEPRPHVSRALAHLRFSVHGCALVLGLCVVAQTAVWATAYFTDARWEQVEVEKTEPAALTVVEGDDESAVVSRTGKKVEKPTRTVVEVNRVPSAADQTMRDVATLSAWAGSVAAIVLVLVMVQGSVIAGGAMVPGLEKAVTATTWAIVLLFLCVPMRGAIPSMPIDGVFAPYSSMTETVEAVKAGDPEAPGAAAFYATYLLVPLVALVGVVLIALRFTGGVEQGIISRSVGEAELRLMREMEQAKRKFGVQTAPAAGALQHTLADDIDIPTFGGGAGNKPGQQPGQQQPPQRPITAPSPGKSPGRII